MEQVDRSAKAEGIRREADLDGLSPDIPGVFQGLMSRVQFRTEIPPGGVSLKLFVLDDPLPQPLKHHRPPRRLVAPDDMPRGTTR